MLSVREFGVSKQSVYLALYRYWAAGSVVSAILPQTTRCGGKGKHRAGKKISLGRKTLAAKRNGDTNSNFALTREDIDHLQFGWRTYVIPGVSVEAAYDKMIRTFYTSSWEHRDGKPEPVPISLEEAPSINQFQYHGERQDGGEKACKQHLYKLDWLMNHRPMAGMPTAGLRRIGAIGQADASSNDVHLISMFDRSKNVGKCSWVIIVDEFTGIIAGLYVGWSVDGAAAKLAMLNAASSKVDYCARYGIQITEDAFPKIHFNTLLVDRGEFNCNDVRTALSGINTSLEYVQTGRGDFKPLVEGKHHALHATSSHRLPGTTRGKHRKRGESDPALDACLTIYEFTADLIRAIIHHNTKDPVPKQLSTEMLQDGVQPTRMSIWQWARKKGYVAYLDCDEDRLVTNLCQIIDAVVHADGVYLIAKSESTGGYEIVVRELRYLGPIAEQHNWLETARRRGSFRIQLYHNPYDLRRVWYLDPEVGLQSLELVSNDPQLEESTLQDILLTQGRLSEKTRQLEKKARQSRIEMAVEREAVVKNAQDEKDLAVKRLSKPPSKSSRLKNRRNNRIDEIAQTGKAATLLTQLVTNNEEEDTPTTLDSMTTNESKYDFSEDKDVLNPYDKWLDEGDSQ
ncbi:hypothetical protein [Sulfurirhabdus autotrophica]|nr:hypothetical protein [Sulfurirhabdus autotrophica]